MLKIEKKYQKQVDELILNSSKKELKKIQEIDLKTQLSGDSFYDLYSNNRYDVKLESHMKNKKKY